MNAVLIKTGRLVGNTGALRILVFDYHPSDIDEIVKKVIIAGVTIIDKGEFVAGSPYVFFNDPECYEIEVWYELLE